MRRLIPYCLAGLIPVLAVAAYLAGIAGPLEADAILAQRETLLRATEAHPVMAGLAFVAVYVTGMSLALPLGGVLGLVAGLLFGRWLGLGLVVAGGLVSAMAVFWVARGTLGHALRERAGPVYARAAGAMQSNAFAYLLFMRIVPIFPFFVVTLVAALLGVRARTFALATVIGKLPSAFIYAGIGQDLGRATRIGDVLTFETFLGLAALGALALAPVVFRHVKAVWSPATSS